jgi:hypothetical protein
VCWAYMLRSGPTPDDADNITALSVVQFEGGRCRGSPLRDPPQPPLEGVFWLSEYLTRAGTFTDPPEDGAPDTSERSCCYKPRSLACLVRNSSLVAASRV